MVQVSRTERNYTPIPIYGYVPITVFHNDPYSL